MHRKIRYIVLSYQNIQILDSDDPLMRNKKLTIRKFYRKIRGVIDKVTPQHRNPILYITVLTRCKLERFIYRKNINISFIISKDTKVDSKKLWFRILSMSDEREIISADIRIVDSKPEAYSQHLKLQLDTLHKNVDSRIMIEYIRYEIKNMYNSRTSTSQLLMTLNESIHNHYFDIRHKLELIEELRLDFRRTETNIKTLEFTTVQSFLDNTEYKRLIERAIDRNKPQAGIIDDRNNNRHIFTINLDRSYGAIICLSSQLNTESTSSLAWYTNHIKMCKKST